MPVDLSGPMRAAIKSLLADAKKAEEEGNREQAVVAYQQVASLYRRWADETSVVAAKRQRLQSADQYEQYGQRLAAGRASAPAPGGSQMERGDEDEEGLERQLEHLIHQSNIRWEDIGGLEDTKQEIKMAFALSTVEMPQGVTLEGWRGILLYGPPGTGKTLLAAATSHSLEATFFNVSLSGILSKYFGESSRLISALYNVARERAPSVVYLDEFEALATQRTGEESGAERRVLSTLLSELDGIHTKDHPGYVLTIAASNVPWLLDKAILSRFQSKILIPLPDPTARKSILSIILAGRGITSDWSMDGVVESTEGYSGRELDALVRSVVNHMVLEANPDLTKTVDRGLKALKEYKLRVRPLSKHDWKVGLTRLTRVTTEQDYQVFLNFEKELS